MAFLLLSPACVASYRSYFLAVAHYAYGNKTVNLLNNQTKSGKESIEFWVKQQILFPVLLLLILRRHHISVRFQLSFPRDSGCCNNFNKKAVLTANTAHICRRVAIRWRKTLILGITWNMLIISTVCFFDTGKNTHQFQEPPFLGAKTAVPCR